MRPRHAISQIDPLTYQESFGPRQTDSLEYKRIHFFPTQHLLVFNAICIGSINRNSMTEFYLYSIRYKWKGSRSRIWTSYQILVKIFQILVKIFENISDIGENVPVADFGHYADYCAQLIPLSLLKSSLGGGSGAGMALHQIANYDTAVFWCSFGIHIK